MSITIQRLCLTTVVAVVFVAQSAGAQVSGGGFTSGGNGGPNNGGVFSVPSSGSTVCTATSLDSNLIDRNNPSGVYGGQFQIPPADSLQMLNSLLCQTAIEDLKTHCDQIFVGSNITGSSEFHLSYNVLIGPVGIPGHIRVSIGYGPAFCRGTSGSISTGSGTIPGGGNYRR